jgi:hypothetical protein
MGGSGTNAHHVPVRVRCCAVSMEPDAQLMDNTIRLGYALCSNTGNRVPHAHATLKVETRRAAAAESAEI